MNNNELNIPVLLGMPRSASRVTWQILKFLLPKTKPESWYPDFDFPDHDWPVRRHAYISEIPAIYTYRHPVEAYLSYLSRVRQDLGKQVPKLLATADPKTGLHLVDMDDTYLMTEATAAKDVMVAIGDQWKVYNTLKVDEKAGRNVLFLKYEDYYDDQKARIEAVAEFVGVDVSKDMMDTILKFTDIKLNAKRGQAITDYFPESIFSHGYNRETGIQKGHINTNVWGEPGRYISSNPEFMMDVYTGAQPALQALNEMCGVFGYDVMEILEQ